MIMMYIRLLPDIREKVSAGYLKLLIVPMDFMLLRNMGYNL